MIVLTANSWYVRSYIPRENKNILLPKMTEKDIIKAHDKVLLITEHIKDLNIRREMLMFKYRYQNVPDRIYIMNDTLVSRTEIENKLSCDYTFIYFYNCDKDVIAQYQFLSRQPIKNNRLYKVTRPAKNIFIIEE